MSEVVFLVERRVVDVAVSTISHGPCKLCGAKSEFNSGMFAEPFCGDCLQSMQLTGLKTTCEKCGAAEATLLANSSIDNGMHFYCSETCMRQDYPAAQRKRPAELAGITTPAVIAPSFKKLDTNGAGRLGTIQKETKFPNGKVSRRWWQDEKGLMSGREEIYYESGILKELNNYLHGRLHTGRRLFRPDGSLERTESYWHGKPWQPSHWIVYDSKGKKTGSCWPLEEAGGK